jgi:general secretion pathway protein K
MNAPRGRAETRQTASEGFIVVAVLWLLAALATFASIYGVYVTNTAAAFRTYDDRLRAEALVSGAVELAAYQLSSKDERRPSHGQFSLRMGQANVAVEFRSEASRIDLNAAPKELLVALFVALGAGRADAENYADRIIAWRTAPVQARNAQASDNQAASRHAPRGAPFPNTGELALLDVPTDLVERTLPLVTVYSGLGKVDVLEATPAVMAALPEVTREHLNSFLAQRAAATADGQALLPLLGRAQAYAGTQASKASRVTVHIAFDDGLQTSSEVVILVYEKGDAPYSVLSWRDQLDGPPTNAGLGLRSR